MKSLLVLLIVMTVGFSSQAKSLSFLRVKSHAVKAYLLEHHPHARAIHQKKISDSLYHVYFIEHGREVFVDITSAGEALFEEKEMMYLEVPLFLQEYLNGEKQYDYGVKVETQDGKVFYFMEIYEIGGLVEYVFDANGKMLMRHLI
ncbi:MAG: hypothetical protein K0R51_2623 [Cytophagaceae bacterium]|jgi:hypothetical protein|nr:hypothetical protein [Cytophagaceae bacterium]